MSFFFSSFPPSSFHVSSSLTDLKTLINEFYVSFKSLNFGHLSSLIYESTYQIINSTREFYIRTESILETNYIKNCSLQQRSSIPHVRSMQFYRLSYFEHRWNKIFKQFIDKNRPTNSRNKSGVKLASCDKRYPSDSHDDFFSADRLFANDTRFRGGDKLTSRKLAGLPAGFLHKPAKLAKEIAFAIHPARVF